MRSLVSNSVYAKKDRNGLPSANQVISIAKPRHSHAVYTLRVHLPTSPCSTLSAEAEPISKEHPRITHLEHMFAIGITLYHCDHTLLPL